jgi:hypothetical protein
VRMLRLYHYSLSTVFVVVLAVVFPIYLCLFRGRGEASTGENV